jgi:hypothetical protein
MPPQDNTLTKLQVITGLYRRGYQSDVIDRTLDKLLAMERDQAQRELTGLEKRLREFETQYRMSSDDFFQRFQRGELGDSADFFEWSACYDMCRSVHDRLETLLLSPNE